MSSKTKTNSKPNINNKRTRVFSLITYVGEENIKKVLQDHVRSLRAYAYILHDKDESVQHHHLLLRTYDAWTITQILKWFDKFKLEINENTLGEPASDLHALRDYITHSDYESIKAGKHRYDVSEIVDYNMFVLVENKDSYDETYAILNDVLLGVKTRELVRRYGKNYLYHITCFDIARDRILFDENRRMSFEDIREQVREEVYGDNLDPFKEFIENNT